MANIETLSESHLFLDEVKDLYVEGYGYMSSSRHVEMAHWYSLQPGQSADKFDILIDGYYFPDFSGRISLDFRDVLKRLIDIEPCDGKTNSPKQIRWEFGELQALTMISLCSSMVKSEISDIDYLAVPEKAKLGLTWFLPENYSSSVVLIQGSHSYTVRSDQNAAAESSLASEDLMLSELPVRPGIPFRFVVRLTSAVDDEPELIYKSPVYEIINREFQQFAFADRFGGYTFIPMSGALELSAEYSFENARYHTGNARVSGSGTPAFMQYTGGLTRKSAAALSDLLLSDRIYHLVGEKWCRILIEDADIAFQTVDSLHYGSFSFRYMDDLTLTDVI